MRRGDIRLYVAFDRVLAATSSGATRRVPAGHREPDAPMLERAPSGETALRGSGGFPGALAWVDRERDASRGTSPQHHGAAFNPWLMIRSRHVTPRLPLHVDRMQRRPRPGRRECVLGSQPLPEPKELRAQREAPQHEFDAHNQMHRLARPSAHTRYQTRLIRGRVAMPFDV